jgi:hypothetical protein
LLVPTRDTTPARQAQLRNAADRAVDDPAQLAKAARIVRAALARRVLAPQDLRGDIVKPADLAGRTPDTGDAA